MYKNNIIPHVMVTNAKDAIAFYVKAFGAKVGKIQYGNKLHGLENNQEAKNTIIHAPLTINDDVIFLAEAINAQQLRIMQPTVQGNNVQLCVIFKSKETQRHTYDILKGNESIILMELTDTNCINTMAMIKDKYGITWQLLYNKAGNI